MFNRMNGTKITNKFMIFVCLTVIISTTFAKCTDVKESSNLTDTETPKLVAPSMTMTDKTPCQLTDTSNFFIPSHTKIHCKRGYDLMIRGMSCTCNINIAEGQRRDDYQYTPGLGGHKFHGMSRTFNEARKVCREEGGHLAIIDSDAEERVLLDLAAKSGPVTGINWEPGAWIGIHDLYAEGEWVTIFDDPANNRGYNRWAGHQPDNAGGTEHCGTLIFKNSAGKMNDLNCKNKQPFWCELPDIQIDV